MVGKMNVSSFCRWIQGLCYHLFLWCHHHHQQHSIFSRFSSTKQEEKKTHENWCNKHQSSTHINDSRAILILCYIRTMRWIFYSYSSKQMNAAKNFVIKFFNELRWSTVVFEKASRNWKLRLRRTKKKKMTSEISTIKNIRNFFDRWMFLGAINNFLCVFTHCKKKKQPLFERRIDSPVLTFPFHFQLSFPMTMELIKNGL